MPAKNAHPKENQSIFFPIRFQCGLAENFQALPRKVVCHTCRWFHRAKAPPDQPEIIVTGAPAGSIVFVDGVQKAKLLD
jgi:hypothetical protein